MAPRILYICFSFILASTQVVLNYLLCSFNR